MESIWIATPIPFSVTVLIFPLWKLSLVPGRGGRHFPGRESCLAACAAVHPDYLTSFGLPQGSQHFE